MVISGWHVAQLLLLRLLLPLGVVKPAWACTVMAVGRDASATGEPMIGHSDDSGGSTTDLRLVRVPRRTWPEGSMRPLYTNIDGYPRMVSSSRGPQYYPLEGQSESPIVGYIPQVRETYGYWDLDYGAQNEVGLSMGESTCTSKTAGWPVGQKYGHQRVGIEELSRIGLERCATARCAVETMGKIAVEEGFFGTDAGSPDSPAFDGASECLVIADAVHGEVWSFNVMTGKNNQSAIWAAERIPPNHVTAIGNAFNIRKINLSDTENFLYSPGVTSLAEEQGWWKPSYSGDPNIFDFYRAYGYRPPSDDIALTRVLAYYSGRRIWRVFSLLSPEEGAKLDPNLGNLPQVENPYPSSVPAPKGSITLQMVQDAYRDHYEGTPYDLTKGISAGPWGNPNRGVTPKGLMGQWERAISMYRTSWSYITVSRPRNLSLMWFGWDAAHGTAYLPFYGAATAEAPQSFGGHHLRQSVFNFSTAWWAFNAVNEYTNHNFVMINKDVRQKIREVEDEAMHSIANWEKEAFANSSARSQSPAEILTDRSNEFAAVITAQWWDLLWQLMGKYSRLVVTHNESVNGEFVHGPGSQEYPEWWLKSPEVGFTSWRPEGPYHGEVLVDPAMESKCAQQFAGEPLRSSTNWQSISVLLGLVVLGQAIALTFLVKNKKCRPESHPRFLYLDSDPGHYYVAAP